MRAVQAILETANPTGKHPRWWNQVYASGLKSIKILHRSGRTNVSADALSRCPTTGAAGSVGGASRVATVTCDKDTNLEDLLQMDPNPLDCGEESSNFVYEQRKDPDICEIAAFLEQGELPTDEAKARRLALRGTMFALVDKVVYFIDPRHHSRKRAVVPAHLREQLMRESHGGVLGSHFAGPRVFNALSRHWWWERMYSDVIEFCKSCSSCAIATGSG